MKIRHQPTAATIAVGSILASAMGVTIVAGGIASPASAGAAAASVSSWSTSYGSGSVASTESTSPATPDATSTGS